jgi:Neuraminidase (sialidase)
MQGSWLRRFLFVLVGAVAGLPCWGQEAAGTRCFSAVDAQLKRERSELQGLLETHHGGQRVDARIYGLPRNDFDDATNLTIRQRLAFRRMNPRLGYPNAGPHQYPHWAFSLMNRRDYEGARDCSQRPSAAAPDDEADRVVADLVVGSNVNASNDSISEAETYLAIDPTNPQILVGASNINISGRGQMMYRSSDGGSSWAKTELVPTRTNHSDPGVNFDTAGNVYSATLDYTSNVTAVKFYKSTDHGATWPTQLVVDDAGGNDKELATIDDQLTSSCRDQIYACWDNGKAQYVASTTAPNSGTFRAKTTVQSKGSTIACDMAVGPPVTAGSAGPVYTVWTSTTQKKINLSKSTDCGATWSAYASVAGTADAYDYGIPAQCVRRVLIYPSVDVDRSSGPRKGWIYVVWNDFTASQGSGCVAAADTNNANVWLSRSTDNGSTWSAPVKVHSDPARTDQFNQWMRTDDADGTIHIMWHDTRNDPTRKQSDVYYTKSTDGGSTFLPEVKVTTARSDETTAGASADQYGDYEALAVRDGCAYAFWTDRRNAAPEEIYSSKVCP